MLIYNEKVIESHVVFIDYTGRYPNLCSGVLTLLIDGQEVRFGHESGAYDFAEHRYKDGNYDDFWRSGGICGFRNDYTEEVVECNPWVIEVADLPEQYRKYAKEIDEVFNSNVTYGCCGGCL